ncbi:MAG TPA: P-loop NTPase [Gemmatimonadaceae bacterium]|nr:P-loop NTPase [Gemmatimonadaceae bacterium]
MSFRTYHDLTGEDRSRLGEQVAAQRERVRERMREVRHVVAVVSGKGGVGKSWVAAALAIGLLDRGSERVGVLDADLKSPTAAGMLRARGPLKVGAAGVHPARGESGVHVMSSDLLLQDGSPLTWRTAGADAFIVRGVFEMGVLREFLGDVAWGALGWLLIDMPPDSDRVEDLMALVPTLAGVVAVTVPSEESRRSVQRAMRGARDAGAPLLGVVENMSGYACGGCGTVGPLFDGNAGDALAAEFDAPLLLRIPFLPGTGPSDAPFLSSRLADAVAGALA